VDFMLLKEGSKFTPEVASAINEAQNVDVGVDSMLKGLTLKAVQAILDVTLFASLLGITATTEGTTPSQILTAAMSQGTPFPYFKLEVQSTRVTNMDASADNAADVHIVVYKAKISKIDDIVLDNKEYTVIGFEAKAVKDIANNNKFWDIVENETATDIA
jgi:hypothetical protein